MAQARNLIKSYSPSGIRIGEQVLARTCIVTADRLIAGLRPETLPNLAPRTWRCCSSWRRNW